MDVSASDALTFSSAFCRASACRCRYGWNPMLLQSTQHDCLLASPGTGQIPNKGLERKLPRQFRQPQPGCDLLAIFPVSRRTEGQTLADWQ